MTTSGWFTSAPLWNSGDHKSELQTSKTSEVPDVPLGELLEKSSNFPRKFPVETVKCHQLQKLKIPDEVLEKNVNSTYPLIHEHALHLCASFLKHQKKFGNKKFYKDMSLLDFIDRLLSKRAVSFLGVSDHYLLLDGTEGHNGWEKVGTPDEKAPLLLQNCLSYNEMKLSAFLSISSHTVFINDGNRRNAGKFEDDRSKVEDDGVIIGLIGTRLPKPYVMECREIVKSEDQNCQKYGYGRFFVPTMQGIFCNFYGDNGLDFKSLKKDIKNDKERYEEFRKGYFFDKLVYCRRVALSIDTLLIEANERAKILNKKAYVHVVGLGLGVWKIYPGQDKLFMDTFLERLEVLSEVLTNISDICFAFIKHKMAGSYKDGDQFKHIKLHMVNKAGPHVKLTGEDEGKLLVVSYAWDCNALPGNEFWLGSLQSSSDPAAACSTQVAELHNWHINRKASAANLRVATLKGLVTFQDYQQMHGDNTS